MNLIQSLTGFLASAAITAAIAQPYGDPDRGAPGDEMIQNYLKQATAQIEARFPGAHASAEAWSGARPQWRQEYFDMLGLWPLPERTPLNAKTTRTIDRGDYHIDLLHYQSRPGLYVTANLYRPAKVASGQRLPAILYVCGHSSRGRNGNKTAFQSHGMWFARHGYICLIVDTLEMGEITSTHHGTYRDGRWWWISRGYTPAGVECWNGIRGIDYLVSRPDVDPARIGVTGISGGGAATFWIAAGDERVKAAVPVSGLSDLHAYVPNRVINGHCDCMFLYNTFQWPWVRIAGMVAPRPLLFVNSDADNIFPMDGNERVSNQLERLYSWFGCGEHVDAVVSVGGHAYRQDIRQAVARFMNIHLKNDPAPVSDTEVDLVVDAQKGFHPIPPEQLRVFPQDSDFPSDATNTRTDELFVSPTARDLPLAGQVDSWKTERLAQLRRLTFNHFPDRVPAAVPLDTNQSGIIRFNSEPGISMRLKAPSVTAAAPRKLWLFIASSDVDEPPPAWLKREAGEQDPICICEPRGLGATRWTRKNPPNYVERSHYLLGRTADSGRVWDIIAAARYLSSQHQGRVPVFLAGDGAAAILAGYAALLEPDVAGLIVANPPPSHMSDAAPVLLNVLRTCDIPEALGMIAPRPIRVITPAADRLKRTAELYRLAGAAPNCTISDRAQ
jgi:dienelactone hydrolase